MPTNTSRHNAGMGRQSGRSGERLIAVDARQCPAQGPSLRWGTPSGQKGKPRIASPMKFATYSDGSRDGELLLVSRDQQTAVYTAGIASKLQQVLDDWNFLAPQLQALYDALNHGRVGRAFAFEPQRCIAPMPRAFNVLALAGSEGDWQLRPLCGSVLQGPTEPVWTGLPVDDESAPAPAPAPLPRARRRPAAVAVDVAPAGPTAPGQREAKLGWMAVLGEVARGTRAAATLEAVRLLMAAQSWSAPGSDEVLALSLAPLAVTPDEWGDDWLAGQLHARLLVAPADSKLPAAKLARALHGPAPGALAAGIEQAARVQGLGPGTLVWVPFEQPVPEWACLDRDQPQQWSVLPVERTLGFGLCVVPMDPQPAPVVVLQDDPGSDVDAAPHADPDADLDAQSDA